MAKPPKWTWRKGKHLMIKCSVNIVLCARAGIVPTNGKHTETNALVIFRLYTIFLGSISAL